MNWEWVCPCCNTEFKSECSVDFIKDHIGSTTDCPECDALLIINDDLTCSDFGEELVRRYAEAGVTISKEKAINSCIRITG